MDREMLAAIYGDDLILMDGFDDCIKGVVTRMGQEPIVCYSKDDCIDMMAESWEITREDAIEYFEFNMIGAWLGDRTPCFIEDLPYA